MDEFGVAHASIYNTYWAFPMDAFLCFGCSPEMNADTTPEGVNADIRLLRERHFEKALIAVVAGPRDWMDRFRSELDAPEYVVYCADESTLRDMGISHIVDEGWQPGDPSIMNPQLVIDRIRNKDIRHRKRGRGFLKGAASVGLAITAAALEPTGPADQADAVPDPRRYLGRVEADKKIYATTFGWDQRGRIDADGKIYDDHFLGRCIARVEENGQIYDQEFSGRCIGRVESDLTVYDAEFRGQVVGRVESDGGLHLSVWGRDEQGRVAVTELSPREQATAVAALLLPLLKR